MYRSRFLAPLALVAALLAPQAATAERFLCSVDLGRLSGGYIPPQVLFDVSGRDAQVTLPWLDGELHTVDGDVSTNNGNRVTVTFEMLYTNSSRQRAQFLYRGTYYRGDSSFQISATPAGYANRFTSRGSCRPA